jgi:hypothetical protein
MNSQHASQQQISRLLHQFAFVTHRRFSWRSLTLVPHAPCALKLINVIQAAMMPLFNCRSMFDAQTANVIASAASTATGARWLMEKIEKLSSTCIDHMFTNSSTDRRG